MNTVDQLKEIINGLERHGRLNNDDIVLTLKALRSYLYDESMRNWIDTGNTSD